MLACVLINLKSFITISRSEAIYFAPIELIPGYKYWKLCNDTNLLLRSTLTTKSQQKKIRPSCWFAIIPCVGSQSYLAARLRAKFDELKGSN